MLGLGVNVDFCQVRGKWIWHGKTIIQAGLFLDFKISLDVFSRINSRGILEEKALFRVF